MLRTPTPDSKDVLGLQILHGPPGGGRTPPHHGSINMALLAEGDGRYAPSSS